MSTLSERAPNTVDPQLILPTPPPTLPAWAKILYYLIESAIAGYAASQYDFGAPMGAVGSGGEDITAGTWRRFVCVWENLTSNDVADDQIFTIDVMNVTDGQLDGTWTTGDYNTVVGQLQTMCSAISPHLWANLSMNQIKAYIMGFNPYTESKPFAHSGAPEVQYPSAIQGGGSSPVPPQACSSITEMTPSRPHWGRFYTPTLQTNSYTTGGHVAPATVDALANAAHDAYENMMGAQFFPVVATTRSGGSKGVPGRPTRTLQTVTGIRVDDVGDIIRRRRVKNYTKRTTLPLPAAQQTPA